jgi:adenine-specific DNA-methyltransferase
MLMPAALPATQIDPANPAPGQRSESAHGEVFTRKWVVELILDLVGYTQDRDLARFQALEPSCGTGAFVVPMVERLIRSTREHDRGLDEIHAALVAIDLLPTNVSHSRKAVEDTLVEHKIPPTLAKELAHGWIRQGDFLLSPPQERSIDFVLGNPPYLRLEAVPHKRSQAYRQACETMGGRADVYVGFYERALRSLSEGGTLGFICADRWMRNAYGSRLRRMISGGWSVESVISMTGVDAFEDEVDAYPAITILRRGDQIGNPAVVEAAIGFGPPEAKKAAAFVSNGRVTRKQGKKYRAVRLNGWFRGEAGWPHGSPDQLALLAEIEAAFPALEDSGAKVGIGVATGADKVFLVNSNHGIEAKRLLPLALPRDIASGSVKHSGTMLVNPWDSDGLVELDSWPGMANYLGQHRTTLAKRHTAKNGKWHRTIDRVIDGLVKKPKLYLPDFKERTFPVLDDGSTYPHHNLYWITSERWDLTVLGGLLLSDVVNFFMAAYSVKMRGGFLRFQAQYLRRIRIPHPDAISDSTASALSEAFQCRDTTAATDIALQLYGLSALPD